MKSEFYEVFGYKKGELVHLGWHDTFGYAKSWAKFNLEFRHFEKCVILNDNSQEVASL